jgi:hypothetical protein
MKNLLHGTLTIALVVFTSSSARALIVFGQRDKPQSGTLQNWTNGPNFPDPVDVATSGLLRVGADSIHAFTFAVPDPAGWGLIGLSCTALVATIVWHRRRNRHALDHVYDEDELFED